MILPNGADMTGPNIQSPMGQEANLCAKCQARCHATEEDLDAVMQVLEVAPTRADAPNASVCRAALKSRYGPKKAKRLKDLLLTDRVIPGTKQYHRRHVMFLGKQPLKVHGMSPGSETSEPTNE